MLQATLSCQNGHTSVRSEAPAAGEILAAQPGKPVLPGIYSIAAWKVDLAGKSIALVANHSSVIGRTHLLDTLLSLGLDVRVVFAPEHGFRGDHPDGSKVSSTVDEKSGVPIQSLYGSKKKPSTDALRDVDVVIFDIQDVGARFFTFLSTLHYAMEAAAESGIAFWVLDRPNPNGFYVDGPVLKPEFKSFVGLHPVPIVYGMTIGEYAQMIKGEAWIAQADKLTLRIVPCANYDRSKPYFPELNPSPNLSSPEAILLYPSLCLFEGTNVSVGRGTDAPFTVIGAPGNTDGDYQFKPEVKPGISSSPPHLGAVCKGYNLKDNVDRGDPLPSLDFSWLLRMYSESPDKKNFFLPSGFFEKLAGTEELRISIIAGQSLNEIAVSWQKDIADFKIVRAKYLIYP